MKLDSLIDNIRDSIVTGLGKKVRVSDKSLFNVLISDIGDDKTSVSDAKPAKGFWQRTGEVAKHYLTPNWQLRFPLTRIIIQALLLLTLLPLFAIYALIAAVGWLLGRRTSIWHVMHSPRTNMLISCTIFVAVITVLVSMLVFFVNDVILYSPQRDINSKGALTISQPCHREHSIFMFNSATLWADTGIDLVAGDMVTISGSGSFDSSIWDKTIKADKNERPKYSLVNIAYADVPKDKTIRSSDVQSCIFNDSTDENNPPRFGSLLYQIQPSQRRCVNKDTTDSRSIFQAKLDPSTGVLNERFKVEHSGTLFVCVNDIYITPELVDTMFAVTKDSIWSVREDYKSTLALYVDPGALTDTVKNGHISQLRQKLVTLASTSDGKGQWLHDNCGDILLSIRVERNIWSSPAMGPVDKIYNAVFRGLESLVFPTSGTMHGLLVFVLCIVAWLIVDWLTGRVMSHKK